MVEMVEAVLMVLESVFPPTGGGGAENQVNTLGARIAERASVRVIAPMVANGPQIAFEKIGAITVERIPYPKVQWIGGAILIFTLALRLVRERKHYSVIHAHIAGNMAAVCCLVGAVLRKAVIVKPTGLTEMVGGVLDKRAGFFARLRRAALRKATCYQATSSQIAKLLADCGFDAARIRQVPNAVDVQRFNGARRPGATEAKTGIYVGRLAPEKGLDLLLRGWARACAGNATLVLVGKGELSDSLVELAKRLEVERHVRFAGASSHVEDFLRQAHFAVLTSLSEGLSNSLLEYMASGLPVIGTRISGTEDFIEHGINGWLFEPNDLDGLVHCLQSTLALSDDELLSMGARARKCVVERASIEVVTQQLFDLYAESRSAVERNTRAQH